MNAIEIEGLTKRYKDFVLDHLNLTLPEGCIMGLIGENGAGKSTTIRLILDMIRRDEGTVTILGRDNQKQLSLTKEEIGVVPDEIGFHDCMNAERINRVMKNTFHHWEEETYYGLLKELSIPMTKTFHDFSRGMRMKLGIAVALSHRPRLLILDEATNGLDPVARDQVVEMLVNFTREETHSVLISSHIVSDLEKICDYVTFLHKGKLLLCEEKDVLLEEYALLHCTRAQLEQLPPEAVLGKKGSPYGMEAVVRREALAGGVWGGGRKGSLLENEGQMRVSPISLEELFVFMVKTADD